MNNALHCIHISTSSKSFVRPLCDVNFSKKNEICLTDELRAFQREQQGPNSSIKLNSIFRDTRMKLVFNSVYLCN